jgi:hypothetical protein
VKPTHNTTTPNFWLWLLRPLGWLLWRDPVAVANKSKREPRPPRRPKLLFAQYPVDPDIHSVIRTTWYKNGRPTEVDEIQLVECPDALGVFHYYVGGALKQGADVTILTSYAPADLGVPQ